MNDFAKIFLLIGALFVSMVFLSIRTERISCEARWEDSGRKYDWSIYGGCRVEDKEGRLIPEKNIRDIQ